jgi:hypothetical protein
MGLIRINVRETREGALMRGTGGGARRLMRHFDDETEQAGADWALDHIKRIYHEDFRHPTGYYESRVFTSNMGAGVEIEDGGEAGPRYGPWLEGVGSRNATTRFKGYHAFRRVQGMLEERYDRIADNILRRWTRGF